MSGFRNGTKEQLQLFFCNGMAISSCLSSTIAIFIRLSLPWQRKSIPARYGLFISFQAFHNGLVLSEYQQRHVILQNQVRGDFHIKGPVFVDSQDIDAVLFTDIQFPDRLSDPSFRQFDFIDRMIGGKCDVVEDVAVQLATCFSG